MGHYRIQGRLGAGDTVSIDQTIIAESDQLAIEMAKGYPVTRGSGLANWARLTNEQGVVLWEVGGPDKELPGG